MYFIKSFGVVTSVLYLAFFIPQVALGMLYCTCVIDLIITGIVPTGLCCI